MASEKVWKELFEAFDNLTEEEFEKTLYEAGILTNDNKILDRNN